MNIYVKRIYDSFSIDDGYRILVERLWPRGISREKAKIDLWMKEIAPSAEVRKRFGHVDSNWDDFKRDYTDELKSNPEVSRILSIIQREQKVTLIYSAKNRDHNSAVFLRDYLLKL
jgi:DNA-3-methyladenine glycosylase